MIPKSIPIQRKEDYHTDCIGKYSEGQYMGFAFFAELRQQRPISVLHLLDPEGGHISSQIWEFEKMYMAEKALKEAIAALPKSKPGNIRAQPFSTQLNGLTVGLIPRDDGACLQYLPYGLAFFPPWNGQYET